MVTRQATIRGIPAFLVDFIYSGLRLTVKLFYGAVPVDPIKAVPNITCPVLFIHEQNDDLTTTQETNRLFQTAKTPPMKSGKFPALCTARATKQTRRSMSKK